MLKTGERARKIKFEVGIWLHYHGPTWLRLVDCLRTFIVYFWITVVYWSMLSYLFHYDSRAWCRTRGRRHFQTFISPTSDFAALIAIMNKGQIWVYVSPYVFVTKIWISRFNADVRQTFSMATLKRNLADAHRHIHCQMKCVLNQGAIRHYWVRVAEKGS